MSLMADIIELIRKEIETPNPDVSDIMLAMIVNIARVEVSLVTVHDYIFFKGRRPFQVLTSIACIWRSNKISKTYHGIEGNGETTRWVRKG